MEPFKALIVPLDAPTEPPPIGGGGDGAHPGHDLPLFPFHPIVVPPGGVWPGEPPIEPPTGTEPPHPDQGLPGEQPRPDIDLPLFPFHPIVVPPGGSWPTPPTGGGQPPYPDQTLPGDLPGGGGGTPTPPDPNAPRPSHPINLPPNDSGYWIFVYIQGLGWVWVAVPSNQNPPASKKK